MKLIEAAAILIGILAIPAVAQHHDDAETVAPLEGFAALEQARLELGAGQAKLTAGAALELALKPSGKAQLAGIELRPEGEGPVFVFEFLSSMTAVEVSQQVYVDAAGSQERPTRTELTSKPERGPLREALATAEIQLGEALGLAQAAVEDGVVVRARAVLDEEALGFEVELVAESTLFEVKLDAGGKLLSAEQAKAAGQAWLFASDEVKKAPPGWQLRSTHPRGAQATWTVTKDAGALSGPNVLTLKTSSAGPVFNLALAMGTAYKDADVQASVRPESGEEDQGGGVLWRSIDADNYYFCRFNPLESNFRVYKVVDGQRFQLQSATVETQPGKWYAVRAQMVGDHITCYLDGKLHLDVRDETFTEAGMVGLWTKADASSSFDNVAVQPLRPAKPVSDR